MFPQYALILASYTFSIYCPLTIHFTTIRRYGILTI